MSAGRRRWGWHQLEPAWAERLVAGSGVRRGDLVIDVGAGTGAITDALLAAGARVVAVELHPERVAGLRRRFEGEPVTVIRADAADLRLPRRPFRVVANPPYGVSNALLRRLLASGSRLQSAHVICQQQVVRRWTQPGAPGAGRWLPLFAVASGPALPRRAFRPPPKVNSRILVVERRGRVPATKPVRSGRARGRGRPGPR